MKFFFITLGCKVNQYETQSMKESMIEHGYLCAQTVESADIVIFNSCTVTSSSEQKLKKLINMVKRQKKDVIIVLTGCLAQAFPEISNKFDFVDVFLGTSNRSELCSSIKRFLDTRKQVVNIKEFNPNNKFNTSAVKRFDNRTRAFLKIEDGCNRFCSYCIIPYARGRVRSKSLKDIVAETTELAKLSYKELVLVGINLSSYGSDIDSNLCDVVESISCIDGIQRIRLGSLEPEKLSIDVIKRLAKQKKLCPQFHLSLQSGCDSTLKRMRRHYTSSEYKEIVNNLRNEFSDPAITTDVMVGFPGETDEEFNESMRFVQEIGFAKMHVFSYSRRPGTKAATMQNQVPKDVKLSRSKKMCEIEFDMRNSFISSQLNKFHYVLFESKVEYGLYEGYSENYIPVKVKSSRDLRNKIVKVKAEALRADKNQIVLIGIGEHDDFIL